MKPMKFSLKMAVEDMPDEEYRNGETAVHFGLPWNLSVYRYKNDLDVFLNCWKVNYPDSLWSIKTTVKIRVASAMGTVKKEEDHSAIFNEKTLKHYELTEFMSWRDLVKENTADSTAMFYCDVTINEMTGIAPKRQRSFEEPEEHLTDVVLTVGEEEFHVAKVILAAQSSYFKTLFFGNFNEAKKPKIELKDVDADTFQIILEIIYGDFEITARKVAGLLELGDKFDIPLVMKRCEEFLLKSKKIKKKEKLRLADTFTLKNLMKDCVDKMTTSNELKSFMPDDLTVLSQPTLAVILQKNLLQCHCRL